MSSPHTPKQNHLLDALPASDYDRIHSHLELVALALGEVLYESGVKLRYIYFLTTSSVSLLHVMARAAGLHPGADRPDGGLQSAPFGRSLASATTSSRRSSIVSCPTSLDSFGDLLPAP
jgi:hypothetical protein